MYPSPHLSPIAEALCKQHEADKKFLEEELKAKVKSKAKTGSAVTSRDNQAGDAVVADKSGPSKLGEAKGEQKGGSARPQQTVLREVNILDDLEKEFNKMYGRGVLDCPKKGTQPTKKVSSEDYQVKQLLWYE